MAKDIDRIVKKEKDVIKKVYHKHQPLFATLERIKLYTSRTGVLHGVKSIEVRGSSATVITHCGQSIEVKASRNSRLARWLRNRWLAEPCPHCKIPDWKLEKYSTTRFIKKKGH